MSIPQNQESTGAFAPKDKTVEVIGMSAFFIVCVLLAALDAFSRGRWWTGGFCVLAVLLLIGAQLLFLRAHATNHAEIEDSVLILRQGTRQTEIDLSQVHNLTRLKVRRGSYGVNTQYCATMRNGKTLKLFEGGTFQSEDDLLMQISKLTGIEWH